MNIDAIFDKAINNCPHCATRMGKYCGDNDEGYVCSRPEGHEGEHMACGLLNHPIRTWRKTLTEG